MGYLFKWIFGINISHFLVGYINITVLKFMSKCQCVTAKNKQCLKIAEDVLKDDKDCINFLLHHNEIFAPDSDIVIFDEVEDTIKFG